MFIYLYTIFYVFWASPQPPIPVFTPGFFLSPDLFLWYVNLAEKGAQKLFKTMAAPAYSIGYPSLSLMHTVAHCVL